MYKFRFLKFVVCSFFIMLGVCLLAEVKLPSSTAGFFEKGVKLTVVGYEGVNPQNNLPVLVKLSPSTIAGFDYADLKSPETGDDLCFIDMEGNGLPFDIDTWNPSGISYIWVNLPNVTNGTEFVMCYGSTTSGKAVCAVNPWNLYSGVWHLEGVNTKDRAKNSDGVGTSKVAVTNGVFGSAVTFPDISGECINCGSNLPNSELKNGFTFESWVKPDVYGNAGDGRAVFGKNDFISLRIVNKTSVTVTTPGESDHKFTKVSLPETNQWYHLAITFVPETTSGVKIYVNGKLDSILNSGKIKNLDGMTEMWIANNQWNQRFSGCIDEVRLAPGVFDAERMAASFSAQNFESFISVGSIYEYEVNNKPLLGVFVDDIEFTNATCNVTISDLGKNESSTANASWVEGAFLISKNSDFSGEVVEKSIDRVTGAPIEFSTLLDLFDTNSTYYIKLVVTNEFGIVGESSPLVFTTHEPGLPEGYCSLQRTGLGYFVVDGSVADFGYGANAADAYFEASLTPEFTDTISSSVIENVVLDETNTFIIDGLELNTTYYLRLVMKNDWGKVNYMPLSGAYSTAKTPVVMTNIGVKRFDDTNANIYIVSKSIEENTSYNVSMYIDGMLVDTWENLTTLDQFTYNLSSTSGASHVARVVVDSTCGEQSFQEEFVANITFGNEVVFLDTLSNLNSTVLFVGDAFILPTMLSTETLVYNTNSTVVVEGNVVKTVKEGASLFRIERKNAITGEVEIKDKGVLIVAPARNKIKGGVFVHRPSGNFSWNTSKGWTRILGTGDFPNQADDVALIYPELTGDTRINLVEDITIGYLGIGDMSVDNKTIYLGTTGSLTFKTSDGSKSWLHLAGRYPNPTINVQVPVTLENDLEIDGMGGNEIRADFSKTLNINEHTLSTVGIDWYGGNAYNKGTQIKFSGDIVGSGALELYADAMSCLTGTKSFTGTIRVANGSNDGNYGGCGLFFAEANIRNIKELKVSGAWMAEISKKRGANVRTGWDNGYQHSASTNLWKDGLPLHISLDGGSLQLLNNGTLNDKANAAFKETGIRDVIFDLDKLELCAGPMSKLNILLDAHHPGTYPDLTTTITNIVVNKGGSSYFNMNTTLSGGDNFPVMTNKVVVVNPIDEAWTTTDGKMQILPFFTKRINGNDDYNSHLAIAIRDMNTGHLSLSNAVSTSKSFGNIRLFNEWNNGMVEKVQNGADWQAVIVNYNRKIEFAEPDSVVKILSGHLSMSYGAEFGTISHENTASSTLDFGDYTAYIYADHKGKEPSKIGCKIVGNDGLVKSSNGELELYQSLDKLTGDVYVNCGILSMVGNANFGDNDVYVYAGGGVCVKGSNPFTSKTVLNLESRDWLRLSANVDMPTNETYKVNRLYINGKSMMRGTYGSSESGAEFISDDYFSGTGVIKVMFDDILRPTVIFIE